MRQIIVPSDFSPASIHALYYTEQLNKILQANINVVHINDSKTQTTIIDKKLTKITTSYPNEMEEEIVVLAKGIDHCTKQGNVVEGIICTVEELKAELIVIGTKARNTFEELFFGSTTETLIRKSPCPVLVIPHNVAYHPPKRILFATDLEKDEGKAFEILQNFAKLIDANIQRVFINVFPRDYSNETEETIIAPIPTPDVKDDEVRMIRKSSVLAGINYYMEQYEVDMVAIYLHDRSLIENLLHRSVAKQLIHHLPLPLLVLNKA